MFNKTYEDRLILWREFRHGLESAQDPIQAAIDFYNQAPYCSIAADPFNPTPSDICTDPTPSDTYKAVGGAHTKVACNIYLRKGIFFNIICFVTAVLK